MQLLFAAAQCMPLTLWYPPEHNLHCCKRPLHLLVQKVLHGTELNLREYNYKTFVLDWKYSWPTIWICLLIIFLVLITFVSLYMCRCDFIWRKHWKHLPHIYWVPQLLPLQVPAAQILLQAQTMSRQLMFNYLLCKLWSNCTMHWEPTGAGNSSLKLESCIWYDC